MTALLSIFFLFWLFSPSEPVCPPLQPEVKPIYSYGAQIGLSDGSFQDGVQQEDGSWMFFNNATVTVEMVSGRVLGTKIGEEPDLEAIEYNKKVRECQVANGEF